MSKSKGKHAKNECAFCYEKRHWKKNCPKLQKGKPTSYTCVAEHDEESDFRLVGMTLICHSDEQILDSGCTYRMCPSRGWFSSFNELNGGGVFMDNDNAFKTMGIGSIQLKNHDGSIQVLTDVHYVPSLKKNIISLKVIESKGLIINLKDGLLKIVAGTLTMIKGTRINKLYYFQGSMVFRSASTVSGKVIDSEATKLWHMSLGHAGKKTLQTSVK